MNKPLYVDAVGIAAPGLPDWCGARTILRGETSYVAAPLASQAPQLLPANERRRATAAVRLAFRAAEDAIGTVADPSALAAVFASSDADTDVVHRLCTALAAPTRAVSPTDFHNSVHNAAAGYWSIATGCRAPSTSLSGWDASFAAGLLEALTLAQGDDTRVLLVSYDIPPPPPLDTARQITQPAGVALVLSPTVGSATQARLELRWGPGGGAETVLEDAALEALRLANPAGRALPLLRLLALATPGAVVLDAPGAGQLRVEIAPV